MLGLGWDVLRRAGMAVGSARVLIVLPRANRKSVAQHGCLANRYVLPFVESGENLIAIAA